MTMYYAQSHKWVSETQCVLLLFLPGKAFLMKPCRGHAPTPRSNCKRRGLRSTVFSLLSRMQAVMSCQQVDNYSCQQKQLVGLPLPKWKCHSASFKMDFLCWFLIVNDSATLGTGNFLSIVGCDSWPWVLLPGPECSIGKHLFPGSRASGFIWDLGWSCVCHSIKHSLTSSCPMTVAIELDLWL